MTPTSDPTRLLTAPVALLCGLLAGCAAPSPQDPGDDDENVIAPAGKEDNFFSNTAQEYLASATVEVRLDAADAKKTAAARLARAQALMGARVKQVGWFLHLYLIDKAAEDAAASYGGLRAMVLDGSYTALDLKPDPADPLRFSFAFGVQVGGTKNLLARLRQRNNLGPEEKVFPLRMVKLDNAALLAFWPWSYQAGKWSPELSGDPIETLPITIEPIPPSPDAYLDYGKMLADDVMDISVHFGWDYHARYDLTLSRDLYTWLTGTMGFSSPASSYEAYSRLSGPLSKKLSVNGRERTLLVSLFRPDPCETWDEDGVDGPWAKAVAKDKKLEERSCPDHAWTEPAANANPTTDAGAQHLKQDLIASLKTRDAILFAGHSGYTFAYALGSWYRTSEGDLDPAELRTLALPSDRSQLFVLSGCDTYHAAQAFKENPNKKGLANADVITTTSFANSASAAVTKSILRALCGESDGSYRAHSFGRLLSGLNPAEDDQTTGQFPMYGIHGLDDNPVGNPLGDGSLGCTSCAKDAECGAVGNVCVRLNPSERVCAAECLSDAGCKAGESCRDFGSSGGFLRGRACVPTALKCSASSLPPLPPEPKAFAVSGDLPEDETKLLSVPVGQAAKNIKVAMTGTGELHLFARWNLVPTTEAYDCRPWLVGPKESCSFASGSGVLEIAILSDAPGSHYNLSVTWE